MINQVPDPSRSPVKQRWPRTELEQSQAELGSWVQGRGLTESPGRASQGQEGALTAQAVSDFFLDFCGWEQNIVYVLEILKIIIVLYKGWYSFLVFVKHFEMKVV